MPNSLPDYERVVSLLAQHALIDDAPNGGVCADALALLRQMRVDFIRHAGHARDCAVLELGSLTCNCGMDAARERLGLR